ncbi:MAG: cob(I)yrinic acid a,c-diamide adenosyltransferase [Geminicoccaceae bacterium]
MVTLTKIYTRGGDEGRTSLGDSRRVAKHSARVEAYGTVDELNAVVGVVRLHVDEGVDAILSRVQNDLFDLGADLCRPGNDDGCLRIADAQVERLEGEIDAMNGELAPLNSFVLPGGSPAAAHLHVARTVCRRAERLVSRLGEDETVNPVALRYLNRLSDHFFVMARYLNDRGSRDVLWIPGANR